MFLYWTACRAFLVCVFVAAMAVGGRARPAIAAACRHRGERTAAGATFTGERFCTRLHRKALTGNCTPLKDATRKASPARRTLCAPRPRGRKSREIRCPVQYCAMFVARPFALNTASATLAGVAARAITTKTTTIKG